MNTIVTTRHRPGPGSVARTRRTTIWRHADPILILAVCAIGAFGCLMVYSATRVGLETEGLPSGQVVEKQMIYMAIGLLLMVAVAAFDYRFWRHLAPGIYVVVVVALLAVLAVGHSSQGSQKWFQLGSFQLEPSEFAKLAIVISLAALAARYRGRLPGRGLLAIVIVTAIPFALIFKQPDLGTALVLLAVLITLICLAGAKLWHLALLVVIGVVGVVGAVEGGFLHGYQASRLVSYVELPQNPNLTQLYHQSNDSTNEALSSKAANEASVAQSKDAIAHGGVAGTGLYEGTSTNTGLVPNQYTDFIFSAVGEQFGLIGSAVLLALYLLVLWRTWRSSTLSTDLFGRLLCVGILAMLLFQVFENIGMTMGITPVTGIPLPWMSYGGSAVIVDFVAIGLVLSVRMRALD